MAGGSGRVWKRYGSTRAVLPGRVGRGAGGEGEEPGLTAGRQRTRLPPASLGLNCLKGSGCGDRSWSRWEKPELARRGSGSHRRRAAACGIGGVTSTLRAGMGTLTGRQVFRQRGCRGSAPGALRTTLPLVPGGRAGSGVEVRGVQPRPHCWEGGKEGDTQREMALFRAWLQCCCNLGREKAEYS